MAASHKQQLFGIRQLHCPDSEPEVDIVAVHGLNGDALETWTSDKSKVCWLNHPNLLPKYLKNARVLTWGYNANVSSFQGRTSSSDHIMQHAHTLIAELQADRQLEGASERPIIWLCHSLGGIIVKRALDYSESRGSSKTSHLRSIFTSTFGILFFGTPHRGSSKAKLLGSLEKIAALSFPKKVLETDSSLLHALEQDSETLQNITDNFAPLLPQFRIFFFWEQERTDLKYTRDYIVDEVSAAPILDGTDRCGIAADHRGMCKFDGPSAPGFRTVMAALQRYCVEAPDITKRRTIAASSMMREKRSREAAELMRIGHRAAGERLRMDEIEWSLVS